MNKNFKFAPHNPQKHAILRAKMKNFLGKAVVPSLPNHQSSYATVWGLNEA